MDKPGQGSPNPQIIDDPKLRSPLRNFFEGSVTAVLWATWIYFLMPVVTLVLWLVGIRAAHNALFLKHGLWELLEILKMAGWVLLLIFTLNLLWAFYNIKFASGHPKVAKKRLRMKALEIDGIERVGDSNRIELVIEEGVPRVADASTL